MPDAELEQIRERLAAVTQSNWYVTEEIDGTRSGRRTVVMADASADSWPSRKRIVTVDQTRTHWDKEAEANIELIAHAPDDLRLLLARVEAAESALASAQAVTAQDTFDAVIGQLSLAHQQLQADTHPQNDGPTLSPQHQHQQQLLNGHRLARNRVQQLKSVHASVSADLLKDGA